MKRAWLSVFAALILAALGVFYFTRTGHAPPGQPSLVTINDSALAALQMEFNRASDRPRVIVLLSPT